MISDFLLELIKIVWWIIRTFWWVWVIALGIILIELGFNYLSKWLDERRWKKWLEERKTLMEWKKMDPRDFERIVAIIFKNLGYRTKLRGGPKDRGIDIEAIKDGKRNFIQCKKMDTVSPNLIREFYGSIVDCLREGEKGIFIITGEFTQEGRELVKDKPIELINGLELEKLAKFQPK